MSVPTYMHLYLKSCHSNAALTMPTTIDRIAHTLRVYTYRHHMWSSMYLPSDSVHTPCQAQGIESLPFLLKW